VSVVLKWIDVDVKDCNVITEPYALSWKATKISEANLCLVFPLSLILL
jgi:hypothetical protein